MKLEMRTASSWVAPSQGPRATSLRELSEEKHHYARKLSDEPKVLEELAAKLTLRTLARLAGEPLPARKRARPERRFNGTSWLYVTDEPTPAEQHAAEGRWFDGVAWRSEPPPKPAA